MSREENEREDLLREATALVERVELEAHGLGEAVVAGFRRDGGASFFFGSEKVYQFTVKGDLRRGFLYGKLYKAERGRLIALTRQRGEKSVALVRHELTAAETARFLEGASQQLQKLRTILSGGLFRVVGQVPPEADVVARVRHWLGCLPGELTIAASPRVG